MKSIDIYNTNKQNYRNTKLHNYSISIPFLSLICSAEIYPYLYKKTNVFNIYTTFKHKHNHNHIIYMYNICLIVFSAVIFVYLHNEMVNHAYIQVRS